MTLLFTETFLLYKKLNEKFKMKYPVYEFPSHFDCGNVTKKEFFGPFLSVRFYDFYPFSVICHSIRPFFVFEILIFFDKNLQRESKGDTNSSIHKNSQ